MRQCSFVARNCGPKRGKTSRKLLFYAAPDTTDSKTAERNIHGVEMRHIAVGGPYFT